MIYGAVQSFTPNIILKPLKQFPVKKGTILVPWTFLLGLVSIGIALSFTFLNSKTQLNILEPTIITGLFLFAIVFAVNSSIHSYLIVAYCGRDKVAIEVGFYYMGKSELFFASFFSFVWLLALKSLIFKLGNLFFHIYIFNLK